MTTATFQAAVFDISGTDPVFSHNLTTTLFAGDGQLDLLYINSSNDFDFRVTLTGASNDLFGLEDSASIIERTVFDLDFGSTSSATYIALTDTTNNLEYFFQAAQIGTNVPAFPTSQAGWNAILDRATWISKANATEDALSFDLNDWHGATVTEVDVLQFGGYVRDEDVSLGDGDDILYSGAGQDIAHGGAGNDRLVAQANDDGQSDTAQFSGGAGNDVLKAKGASVATFYGNTGDDLLVGGDADDSLNGGAHNDILFGFDGADQLVGGNGADQLYGGRDNDVFEAGDGDDILRGNRGDDVMQGGTGDDDLRGGGQQDDLQGQDGDDFLFGENGLDRLDGGAGNDVLTGGYGGGQLDGLRDTFVFAPGGGYDKIKDFENGIDQIDLAGFGFTDFSADVLGLAADTSTGLRIRVESGTVLFIEDFVKADFDASDVIL